VAAVSGGWGAVTLTRKTVGILVILLSILVLTIGTACDSSKTRSFSGGPRESLTLGTTLAIDLSSLIWVAKGKGYFDEQGLDVNIKLYESGHLALQDMLAGNLDIATATEFASVRLGIVRPDFRIISILDEAEDQRLVAKKDSGITQRSDLRNKRIGLARGTSSEYYLHLMLILEKIPAQDVHLVDVLPSQQVKALAAGDVDAVMAWEPFASMAIKELGTNGVSWPGQSGEDEYWLLVGIDETLKKRSSAVRRVLAALASAEDFIKNNGDEAARLVTQQWGDRHMDSLWKNHSFRLGLHRPLILKMEAELRWMKSKPGSEQSAMPDLVDFIYFDALNSVKPERVRIITRKDR
jgi:ABC-type nitrate/sulfonate/bicarbonate transport system substrate-binding protein